MDPNIWWSTTWILPIHMDGTRGLLYFCLCPTRATFIFKYMEHITTKVNFYFCLPKYCNMQETIKKIIFHSEICYQINQLKFLKSEFEKKYYVVNWS